ncbi:MAG: preprotein translocase subunit SecA, partial [Alphaproteobacteria bacterium]
MLQRFAKAIFGNANSKYLKGLETKVEAINALEPEFEALSDADLKGKTAEFKQRLSDGETLDDLLVEAFAAAREAGKRALGMRMFDVQLLGAMVLHEGRVAEMKTGEGKTLTATAAAYLNALDGKGVHIITVNEYLVMRDAADMGKLYQALGLSTGYVTSSMGLDRGVLAPAELDNAKRRGYAADVTYSIAAEVGFDSLRDQMKPTREEMVQRGFNFVIVDEADSVLIDEARTPLVMSGPAVDVSNVFRATDLIAQELSDDAFTVDEKTRNIQLSEEGVPELEEVLRKRGLLAEDSGLYQPENVGLLHNIMASIRA